jgi:hypothetical protein
MELGVEPLRGRVADIGAEPPRQLDPEQSRNAVGGDAAPEGSGDEQLAEPASSHGPMGREAFNSIMDAEATGSYSVLPGEQPSPEVEALAKLNPGAQRLDGAAREGHGATGQQDLPALEVDVSRA